MLIKTGSETKLVHISHSISAVFSEQNILRSNQTHECCINIAGENMDELYRSKVEVTLFKTNTL